MENKKPATVSDIPTPVLRELIFFGTNWIINLIAEMVNRKVCRQAEKKTLKNSSRLLDNILLQIVKGMHGENKSAINETIEDSCDFYYSAFSLMALVKEEHREEALKTVLLLVSEQYEINKR